jgi:hypothetical protein
MHKIKLLLLLLLCSTVHAQQTDVQKDGLKGKVKLIIYKSDGKSRKLKQYDKKGNVTESITFCIGKDSTICSHAKYQYDTRGNVISIIGDVDSTVKKYGSNNNELETLIFNKGNRPTDRFEYTYNDKQQQISSAHYNFFEDKEILLDSSAYFYNEKGYLVKDERYTYSRRGTDYKLDGLIKKTYQYDDKGNKIKVMELGALNDTGNIELYTYDNLNRNTVATHKFVNNRGGYTDRFQYDSSSHITEWASYKLDSTELFRNVFIYDGRGNKTKSLVYRNDKLKTDISYTYDVSGFLIEEAELIDGKLNSKKDYTNDVMGNAVLIKSLYGIQPQSIEERRIAYY